MWQNKDKKRKILLSFGHVVHFYLIISDNMCFFLVRYCDSAGFDGVIICRAVHSTFFSALPHIVGRRVGKGAFTSAANSKPKGLFQRAETQLGVGSVEAFKSHEHQRCFVSNSDN